MATSPVSDDVVCLELPAPAGWNKKLVLKKGGTPKKNEVIFTSPTGDLLTSRKQLDQYLKSHPGGPSAAEFDWGTGETPRRSARISGKAKAVSPLDSQSPKKKRSRKSSTLKKKEDAEEEKPEKEIAPAETGAEDQKEAVKEAAEDAPVKDEEALKEGQAEEEGEKPEPVKDETEDKAKEAEESVHAEKKEESVEKLSDGTDVQIKEAAEPAPVEAGKSNGSEEAKQIIGTAADIGSGMQNGDEVQP